VAKLLKTQEVITTSKYMTDEVWAVLDKADTLVAVGIGVAKTKAAYVGAYETLDDDPENIDEQFENLIQDTEHILVKLEATYTVERKQRLEK